MSKVTFKNQEDPQSAKDKVKGAIRYRKMKDGRIIAAKWPRKNV